MDWLAYCELIEILGAVIMWEIVVVTILAIIIMAVLFFFEMLRYAIRLLWRKFSSGRL
jgi:hypothetical protein